MPKAKIEDIDFLKTKLSEVKHKERRKSLVRDLKIQQRKERITRRKQRKADGLPKQIPKTIENMREADLTEVNPEDEEVLIDEGLTKEDMESVQDKTMSNKVLVTCSSDPSRRTRMFCRQLAATIPNAEFRWRRRMSIKRSSKQLITLGYTMFLIVTENREEPTGMLISRLPDGPTAKFRLSSMQLAGELHGLSKRQSALCAPPSLKRKLASGEDNVDPDPQLLANNFTTRLGIRLSTMFSSIFPMNCGEAPPVPVDNGRVVTFHNQRDFIFFRQHKFSPSTSRLYKLVEIGPRFTLKLRSLQPMAFDRKNGEFEWVFRHHEMESSRRKFVL